MQSRDDCLRQYVEEEMLRPLLFDPQRLDHLPLAVAEMFLLERRANACSKKSRIERLGKVVIGSSLDATDDRVEFAQCRDHDDGDLPESWIALKERKDIIAADSRHHQIEQDEIDGLLFDHGERDDAIFRLKHSMALALQATGKKVSVRRIIVHHQNPAGSYGRKVRFLRCNRADRLEQALDHPRWRANLGGDGASSIRWRSIATRKCHQTI